jgi:hypothetical protein
MAVLKVATCQFPVSADIGANLRYVIRQMGLASQRGARVAHFPEGSLSGYAGTDFASFAGFGWDQLDEAFAAVAEAARKLGIWVVLGSAHRLSDGHKPHNSSYVISDSGQITERYDKRFCSGDSAERTGDLAHYSPGRHFSVWSIDGWICGALICYDYRFPELYREYKKRGVQLMFHSFYAARFSAARIVAIGQTIGPEFAAVNRSATHTYDRGRGRQPRLDQLPELLGSAELLASLFRPGRRRHHRAAAAQRPWRPGLDRGPRARTVRLDRRLAGPCYVRRPAQRHLGRRSPLRGPHPGVTVGPAGPCRQGPDHGDEPGTGHC